MTLTEKEKERAWEIFRALCIENYYKIESEHQFSKGGRECKSMEDGTFSMQRLGFFSVWMAVFFERFNYDAVAKAMEVDNETLINSLYGTGERKN